MIWLFTFIYAANGIALFSSVYRLVCKLGGRGLWWDDPMYIAAEAFNLVIFGGNIFAHIHFAQQELPIAVYIWCINAYFMATWIMRCGVSISLIRNFLVLTDRIREAILIAFFFVLIGLVFCVSGTVLCIRTVARQGSEGFLHLPFIFTVLAILSDIFADSYIAFTAYKFFMGTTIRPRQKIFSIIGFCGPLSTMFVTTVSWIVSLTVFSSNLRAQMCMLNITACYSVTMVSTANVMRYLYINYFPDPEPFDLLDTQVGFRFRRPNTTEGNQHGRVDQVCSSSEVTQSNKQQVRNHTAPNDQRSSMTIDVTTSDINDPPKP